MIRYRAPLARKERLAVRDDSITRDARDADHIWLRQSVTFSVNGQTRTLEMALPLRPGATPDEVDALLDEADAGMRRLSQRLDAHLAEVTAAPALPVSAPVSASVSAPVSAPIPTPERSAPPAVRPTPPPVRQPTAPHPAATPAPAPAPASRAAALAPVTAPASSGPDLTRPEFLAAIRALGLDARTVMERLKVRSLDGLNLRESLELLRRQSLRDGEAPEPPANASTRPPAISEERAAALAAMPAPIGRADAARFEEEEDDPAFEVSYPDPDDLPGLDDDFAEEEFAPQEMTPAAALDDVPDGLNEPPTAPVAAAPATPTAPPEAVEQQEPPAVIRAREVIATLRAAHTGGQPTAQQRKAYANMVVGELGEAKAAGVIRAVWSLTPDKLGPEQYDELIRWGKLDTFADEVESVLDLLRAEWIAQHGGAQPASQPAAPAAQPAEPPTKPAARRPAANVSEGAAEHAPQEQPPAPRPTSRGRSASANSANSASSRADARTQGGA